MKRALIADDTKNIRLLLSRCLEHEGYQVATAQNGPQALEMAQSTPYDLIMLDIKMPEMSGTEVLRRLRQQHIDTPVVVMTAYGAIKNAVETTNLGALCYLQKPFTADKIKKVLEELQQELAGDETALLAYIEGQLGLGAYSQAADSLLAMLPRHTLDPEIYRLLAAAARGQGDVAAAEKYQLLCDTLRSAES